MTANINPIFTLTPHISWSGTMTAANTAVDGTGTVGTCMTATANGTFCQKLRAKPMGTNVATVLRIFINNGSDPTVATNNVLWDEITLPATTASNSASLSAPYEVPLGIVLPSGYKVNVCMGTAVSAGWNFSVIAGDY